MTYEPKPFEIAGVDMYGERQDDGSIKLGSHSPTSRLPDTRTHLPEFPETVAVCGVVYTLEFIRENENAKTSEQKRICWGVYV